jgi:hypothetical protein
MKEKHWKVLEFITLVLLAAIILGAAYVMYKEVTYIS